MADEGVVVAVDIETTGGDPSVDCLIEVGAVKFRGVELLDTYHSMVDPHRDIPWFITDKTGIKAEDVAGAAEADVAVRALASFVGTLPVVSHEAGFEQRFLWPFGVLADNEWIDTLSWARRRWGDLREYTLGGLADYLGFHFPVRHRALEDAWATAMVYLRLSGVMGELGPVRRVEMVREQRWVRIVGDGLAWSGSCLLTHIIFWPHTTTQYVDVYDGRDVTSGKKFCRLDMSSGNTHHISLGSGVRFDVGIYLDGLHAEDETTVVFVPV